MFERFTCARSITVYVFAGVLCVATAIAYAGLKAEVEGDLEVDGEVSIGDPGTSNVQLAVKGSDTALSAESMGADDYGIWAKGEIGIQAQARTTSSGWAGGFLDRGVLIGDPATPTISGLGGEGDLFVRDALEVDGSVSIDANTLWVDSVNNRVGIRKSYPQYAPLEVDHAIGFVCGGTGAPAADEDFSYVWGELDGGIGQVYVKDGEGTETRLTSHKDPRTIDENVDTSFADPNITIPFSFQHENAFLGKGAVVDLASVVADLERMTGRSYTLVYDLQPEEKLDVAQWLASQQIAKENRAKQEILDETPEVEISPEEGIEYAEVMRPVVSAVTRTQYFLSKETGEIEARQVEEEVVQLVGTGEYEYRLKDRVRLDEDTGKLYRRRTLDEIAVGSVPEPQLSQWIVDRLPTQ